MADELRIVEVTADNYSGMPCCGIKDTSHEGYESKSGWLKTYFKKGVKVKLLFNEKDMQCGFIEYLPGEFAWRGVQASNYMFIHCIWTYFKKNQHKGYGKLLIDECVKDAKKAKMKGVAVLARKKPWLANSDIFIKNGFEAVDSCEPDYELLVKRFNKSAVTAKIKNGWDKKLKKYGKGLTIIRATQCPHTIRFSDKIAAMAATQYKLKPQIIELKTYKQAQNAPTPYAAFAVIYDGQLLADHHISAARFKNIMKKL